MKSKVKYIFRPIIGEYDFIDEFREGLAYVRNNCEEFKVGYIDKTGEVVIPLEYYGRFERIKGHPKFVNSPSFSEGFAALISKDGKFGFVDKKGKVAVPFEYDSTCNFVEALAAIKKNNKWGFVNKTGEVVIPLEYDWVFNFHEGLAPALKNGKLGYINKTGKTVIPFEYNFESWEFSGGIQ
jgi:hypothetical protein